MIASGHDHYAAFDLIAIVLPSALALFSALTQENVMRSWIARRSWVSTIPREGLAPWS
jgi:hypothetical protein